MVCYIRRPRKVRVKTFLLIRSEASRRSSRGRSIGAVDGSRAHAGGPGTGPEVQAAPAREVPPRFPGNQNRDPHKHQIGQRGHPPGPRVPPSRPHSSTLQALWSHPPGPVVPPSRPCGPTLQAPGFHPPGPVVPPCCPSQRALCRRVAQTGARRMTHPMRTQRCPEVGLDHLTSTQTEMLYSREKERAAWAARRLVLGFRPVTFPPNDAR